MTKIYSGDSASDSCQKPTLLTSFMVLHHLQETAGILPYNEPWTFPPTSFTFILWYLISSQQLIQHYKITKQRQLSLTQTSYHWILGALSLRIKYPVCEANHSPPSSTKVREVWNIYLLFPYTFGVSLRNSSNFTSRSEKVMIWMHFRGRWSRRSKTCTASVKQTEPMHTIGGVEIIFVIIINCDNVTK
jgi:hypothetical protein